MVTYTDTLNTIFFALADPTRRAILTQLKEGQKTVGELAEPFGLSPSGFAKHLRVLERAGLMVQHKRGRERHCQLVVEPIQEATTWLEQYRQMWEASLDAFADYVANLEKPPKER
jgi:DNA-binding transcriptional ArsR family regulator